MVLLQKKTFLAEETQVLMYVMNDVHGIQNTLRQWCKLALIDNSMTKTTA